MVFYRDPTDGRVFVPKEGGGVSLNYAHGISWAILISMTVVPLVIVVVVTIAVLA
ncbi:peptide ABC transporter substrate-binding protein [Actinoplanes sp. NPDC051343]|jgi:uncharacterized membrane protein|uniref:peptide ABC transporter substrate-binding protein n=1 Tax=Actinoplanes sp. NPDC051343 TaxID=3363906 RepID=UPI0037A3C418